MVVNYTHVQYFSYINIQTKHEKQGLYAPVQFLVSIATCIDISVLFTYVHNYVTVRKKNLAIKNFGESHYRNFGRQKVWRIMQRAIVLT